MMTFQPEHVIVVGAGLGGLRTAQQLRSAGFQGRLSLVGAERHAPYDRPPLSKQVLSLCWGPEKVVLSELGALEDIGVRIHLGLPAVALHPGTGPGRPTHELELADGSTLHGDAVVIATGLAARTLPGQPEGVHTLRTLDDALALRDAFDEGGSVVIVGAGFIGAEVATYVHGAGLPITMLDAVAVPSARALGPEMGALASRLAEEHPLLTLRTSMEVTGFADVPTGVGIALGDGSVVRGDIGLVGIGGAPNVSWLPPEVLESTGVGGVHCGPTGRVHGMQGVWAVGDVAAWDDPLYGRPHRHEHWTNAGDQANVVAHDVLGAPPPAPTVPYFWSDQFDLKIQLLGRPELADTVLPLHGTGLDGGEVRGTVAAYLAEDRVVAVAGFGAARYVVRYRPLVAAAATSAEVLETAAGLGAPRVSGTAAG
jgi:NADPH-dependent 2,4-dienoyl-CoA reductase/sulfur reductase-like enzyme